MTVKSLIKRLQKYPPTTQVFVRSLSGIPCVPYPHKVNIPPKDIVNFNPRYHKVNKKSGYIEGIML